MVRERPAAEPPLVALRETVVDWFTETGAAPTLLVSGPPKGMHEEHHEAHALKNDLENAITDAFMDRLVAAGADPEARSTLLRAAVQARAGVSAIRGMMVAYPVGGGECGEERGMGPLPVKELTELVRQAFAALES